MPLAERLGELGIPATMFNAVVINSLDGTRLSNIQTEMYADLGD